MFSKYRTSTVFVVITVLSLVLGACAAPTALPTAVPTTAPISVPTAVPATGPTSAPAAAPVILVAQNAALGNLLTDSKGMTLYVYTKDTAGVSNCSGDCAGIWPPLTVPTGSTPAAGSGFSGTLGTIQRADGTTQVTVNNMPVYLWVKDKNPGDTTGQNVGKVWFVLDASGKIVNTVPAPAATTAPAAGSLIMVGNDATLGSILTDSKGMTLYIYTKDTPGVSNCSGGCATAWPPLTVASGVTPTADSKFTGKLGTIQRADGTTQVTVNDMPVYYFAKDKKAGDTTGQNVGKVWFVLDASGKIVSTVPAPAAASLIMVADNAALGSILTDSKGMTLYIYTKDTPGVSNCSGGCATAWPPLTVASGVTPTADSKFTGKLGTIQRADGTTQVTVNDQPVYYFAKDKAAGDTTGQNVGKVWFVLDASGKIVSTVPAPAAGSLIMVADTANMGSILTDSKGMTLYIYTKDTPGVSNCSGGCATAWPPLTVASGVTPTADSKFTGKLGTIQRADGTTQVTVNDMPVYYFAKDKNPGDATGQKVGSVWFVIDATGAMMNK